MVHMFIGLPALIVKYGGVVSREKPWVTWIPAKFSRYSVSPCLNFLTKFIELSAIKKLENKTKEERKIIETRDEHLVPSTGTGLGPVPVPSWYRPVPLHSVSVPVPTFHQIRYQ